MSYFRVKLLVIDSDAADRIQLRQILNDRFILLEAADAGTGAALLETNPDVLLVLAQSGAMDQEQSLLLERLDGIPVVLINAHKQESSATLSVLKRANVIGMIRPPIHPEIVGQYLQNLTSVLTSENQWDEITGLYNRGKFLRKTEALLAEHPDEDYIIGSLNIRGFRLINDLYEISTGDRVLRAIAEGLKNMLPSDSVCGRLEADKFAFCCPAESFDSVRLLKNVDASCASCNLNHSIVVLMGLYETSAGRLPASQMCDRALMALGNIDESSPLRYTYFDEEQRLRMLREQEISSEMEHALESGQFHIYVQPIYSLSTERPIGAEALVRWIHPEKGVIPPDRFIPLFERNGFITKIDYCVWEQVFALLAEMKRDGKEFLPISVNMSRADLYEPERTYEKLIGLSRKYQVPTYLCHIEITETAYMENPKLFLSAVKRLRAAGFSLIIDDFGSGYSSLNTLTQIPADVLKLDMGFVRGLTESGRSRSIVDSVIRMAKWLEMSVVAEGVETQEQLSYLRSIGCDRVQGYYYSRPLPAEEFRRLLSKLEPASNKPEPERPGVLDPSALWDALLKTNRQFHGIMGAMGIYELYGDRLEVTYVNDDYYSLFGRTPDDTFSTVKNALAWVKTEDRPKLMEALHAARQENTLKQALVREYTRSGGTMWISTSITYLGQRGERDFFCISIKDAAKLMDKAEPNRMPPRSEQPDSAPSCCGQSKILIVDDNAINRGILREILADEGPVLEAENGQEALEQLESCPCIRAILLDLMMPVMDGLEFLRRKKETPEFVGIPVLVLSAANHGGAEEQARALGANGFLRKPYDSEKIHQILNEISTETIG